MFLQACVCPQWGSTWPGTPPDQVHPSQTRYTPPPGPGTPPDQIHPPEPGTPPPRPGNPPPPEIRPLLRTVRILLEYTLVRIDFQSSRSLWNEIFPQNSDSHKRYFTITITLFITVWHQRKYSPSIHKNKSLDKLVNFKSAITITKCNVARRPIEKMDTISIEVFTCHLETNL